MIDIVGEGEVIDQERLQSKRGGTGTIEEKIIPKIIVFPAYKVENPDPITLYCPKPAKIVSVSHQVGSNNIKRCNYHCNF